MDKRIIIFAVVLTITFYFMQFLFPPPKVEQVTTQKISKEKKVVEGIETFKAQQTNLPKATKIATYVIQNDFQQLVFSTLGGSLTEINLPFKSKSNGESIINEIEFDKGLKETSPQNATFPLSSYFINDNGKVVEKKGKIGGYYPLIRRELIGVNKNVSPKYFALNIISDTDNLENQNYELVRLEKDLIQFQLTLPNRKIIKTYQFSADAPYTFEMSLSIEGDAKNLWITTGVPEVELTSGRYEPVLKIRTSTSQKATVDKISLPKTETVVSSIIPDWICNSNGFLGIIIDPLTDIANGYKTLNILGKDLPTRISLIDAKYNAYPQDKYPGYEMFLPIKASGKYTFRVFAGPFSKDMLLAVDETFSNAINGYNPEYVSARSFHGIFSFISEPFAKLMFSLMQLFYKVTHSWGFSIIILTLVLRIMLYPLNAWTIKSQMKMQELAPKIQAIQTKYAKNPQKAKIEIMNLYREKGANPLLGCFPILIQIPFLIGMFDLLKSTFELRGASFIPHWIDNLTAPDVLFSWQRPIPLIGREFHLLPIIMGVVMFLQSKFQTAKPKGPMTDQQRQQQAMTTILPIVFTIIFYKMPSGLNIYYLFFSLFGIVQQWYMNKMAKKKIGI